MPDEPFLGKRRWKRSTFPLPHGRQGRIERGLHSWCAGTPSVQFGRDAQRLQLGAGCPLLVADPDHSTWTFAVGVPLPRAQTPHHPPRRLPHQRAAATALRHLLEGENGGFNADPNQTIAEYLTAWLNTKELALKPTTLARYHDYVTADLTPALGHVKLDELGYHYHASQASPTASPSTTTHPGTAITLRPHLTDPQPTDPRQSPQHRSQLPHKPPKPLSRR